MKQLFLILATLISISLLWSCKPYCQGCQAGLLSFRGYDTNDLKRVVIRRYVPGDSFKTVVDSTILSMVTSDYQKQVYDTDSGYVTWVSNISYQTRFVNKYYDYEIVIPEVARMYRISDMVCSEEKSKESCLNNLESYRLNDTLMSANQSGMSTCTYCKVDILLKR